MKSWPTKKDEHVNFSDLTEGILHAVRFAYKLTRKNAGKDIPYQGYDIGDDVKAGCPSPDIQLSAEHLRYSEEDQGREPIETIIGVAVQIGIEQGRRLERADMMPQIERAILYSKYAKEALER